MKIKILSLAAVAFIINLSTYVYINNQNSNSIKNITCHSDLIFTHNDEYVQLHLHFILHKDNGLLVYTGKWHGQNKEVLDIYREVDFNYLHEYKRVILKSVRTYSSEEALEADDKLVKLLPMIFLKKDQHLSAQLSKVGNNGYMISYDGFPSFYCGNVSKSE